MNYRVEWMPIAAVLGLVTLLFVPVLGFLVALTIAALAAMALVALVAAVIAAPFLIVRVVRSRWQARTAGVNPDRVPATHISSEAARV
jgi:cation transporter-like permease